MLNTILFDLDGTLLPMDQEKFLEVYFHELTQKMAAFDFEPPSVIQATWAGTKAMIQNNGPDTNETVFWKVFSQQLGEDVLKLKPVLEEFYVNEFHRAQVSTTANPYAPALVRALREKGYTLVLASNPLFPRCAFESRLSWAGLQSENFQWLTHYANSSASKPNPNYYRDILRQLSTPPENCLMGGNDVQEDGCARKLGIDFYLVSDCLINKEQEDLSAFTQGSFTQFAQWASTLPSVSAPAHMAGEPAPS